MAPDDAQRVGEATRLSATPLLVLLVALALALSLLSPLFRHPNLPLNLAVGLYIVTALLWVWHQRAPASGRWAALLAYVALMALTVALFRQPQIAFLSCLISGYAVAMFDLRRGVAVALGQTALLAGLALAQLLTWGDVAFGAALNGGVVVLLAAILRPIYTLTYWAQQRYDQARGLLEEARDRQVELKTVVDALAHANRELSLAHDRLAVLRLAAEDARRTKATFVANVSHEFRAPLNIIVGMAEILLDAEEVYGHDLPLAVKEDIEVLHRNCQHLTDLVNDVLDLSQIEAERLALRREWVDLRAILASAVQIVQPLAGKKGLSLEVRTPKDLPRVYCDPRRIRQVVLNLVSNAARFTESGGIFIETRVEGCEVFVSVRDTGPGIAPDDLERIFEPFQQSAAAGAVLGKGSGLGLAISREFIRMHEGTLWVQSTPGEGSTFTFRLPVTPPPEPLAPATRWVYEDWSRRTSSPPVEAPRLADRAVLLDSSGQLQSALSRYADELELVAVSDAASAEEECQAHAARTVIVGSQEMDELIARVEALRVRTRGAPLFGFLLSRGEQPRLAAQSLAYITKPVSSEDLRQALAQLTEAPQRILVVDDEPDARRVLAARLRGLSDPLEIREAGSAREALTQAAEWHPDVILLDLVMPETDGWAVVAELSAHTDLQTIPVVLISGRDRYQEPLSASLLLATTQDGIPFGKLVECYRAVSEVLLPRTAERGREPRESSPG